MERTATWSRIGTDVSQEDNLNSVLKRAGLDFVVSKKKIFTSEGIEIPNVVATVREDTKESLGIVGSNYNICQNYDAFDFVNYIEDDVKFVKAGMTYGGLIYVIGKLPQVDVLGDSFEPYIIFQNGHNGGISVKAAISPLRIVCQNQFNYAFKNAQNTISIKHNGAMNEKLVNAREVLKRTNDYMKELTESAESYSKIKMTPAEIVKFVDKFFPIEDNMTDKHKEQINAQRSVFMSAYNESDNANFRGSAWGMINAYSDYLTHGVPTRITKNWEDNKFCCVTLNPSMAKFIEMINSSVNV